MKKLFAAADRYVETSDWKTIAVLKFCLLSLGLMAGMQIRPEHRRPVLLGALGVFVATYIPLMLKFFRIFAQQEREESAAC